MAKQYRLAKNSLHDKFLHSRSKIQFMGGGFGNGKTSAVVNKTLIIAKDYPGANILVARSTYPKLNDTIRKALIDDWCPKDWVKRRPTKDDNTLILKNDTHLNFRYVAQRGKTSEDGTTTSNLLSANYDLIVVDQIEDPEIGYKDFTDLMGRLRGNARYIGDDSSMPLSGPRWMLLTANPSMNWVYQKLVKPVYEFRKSGKVGEDLIINPLTGEPWIALFEGSTYENSLNLDSDYIQGLEATYKGQQRERYLMGGWAAYEGLVYPTFDPTVHVVPHDEMIAHLRSRSEELYRNFLTNLRPRCGYDYGLSSPACYLQGAMDPESGILFVYDGFYDKELQIAVQADYIHGLHIEHRSLHTGSERRNYEYPPVYSDPQIFKRTGVGQKTISGLFNDYGIPMFRGANDITTGIAKISELLAVDDYLDNPFTGTEHSPRVFFSDKLSFLADEFTSYYWKRNPFGMFIEEPVDKDDHGLDAFKYLITDYPRLEELRSLAVHRRRLFQWHEPPDAATEVDYRHG
jgi:hypothetical protein